MNKNKINDNLIVKFRDKVNSKDFIFHKYGNIDGKNRFKIICSCMDWISVAIRTLDKIDCNYEDKDILSMQVYSYISKIDIINESIKQLHRVLIDRNTIPFKDSKKIFLSNNLNKDDNEYFKHIRAIFGAHPVDIKDNGEEWFASWSYEGYSNDYDFQVILYSNQLVKKDIVFGIKFNELDDFLLSRYSYLETLIEEIDKQYKQFCEKMISKKIENNDDILTQLYILKEESKLRLNSEYYNSTINQLITIFETVENESKPLEIKYKKQLKKLITEIYNNLQNMKIKDLKNDYILNYLYTII